MSPTTLAEAPYLDVADPAFSIRSAEVKAARAQSWFARTPYGIAVLRYDKRTLVYQSRFANARHDPMLSPDGVGQMNALYLDDALHDNPLVSPVFGDFSGLPPTLAQVGSTEILLDDTRRVGERARAQGVDFEVEVWDEVPHVWHVWAFLPESKAATTRIAKFIREHTQLAPAAALAPVKRPRKKAEPAARPPRKQAAPAQPQRPKKAPTPQPRRKSSARGRSASAARADS